MCNVIKSTDKLWFYLRTINFNQLRSQTATCKLIPYLIFSSALTIVSFRLNTKMQLKKPVEHRDLDWRDTVQQTCDFLKLY